MKGLILIPEVFKYRVLTLERYMYLFNLIKNELGFNIIFANDYDPNNIDVDIVMIFKSPQQANPHSMKSLKDLPKNIKLITYCTDVHGVKSCMRNREKLLIRADKILCPYDYAFKKRYENYVAKYEFFPQFFTPYEYYKDLKLNVKPLMKCLLSGEKAESYYPLRAHIYKSRNKNVVNLPHPGYGSVLSECKVGIDYPDELHKYFCCVATSSRLDYVVAKYFEIPAVGSLLLANYTPDLDKLGFIDGKHYIAINKKNFFDKLDNILKNPEKYEQIRHEGRKFVLENFSEIDRFEQFKRTLGDLL